MDFDRISPADQCQVVVELNCGIGYELRGYFYTPPLKFVETRCSHLTTDYS